MHALLIPCKQQSHLKASIDILSAAPGKGRPILCAKVSGEKVVHPKSRAGCVTQRHASTKKDNALVAPMRMLQQ